MSEHVYSKSAPRLLQDLSDYNVDGSFWDLFATSPSKAQCEHVFIKTNERSSLPTLEDQKPSSSTKWGIALTCQTCLIHIDVGIAFESSTSCPSSKEAPLHHFYFDNSKLRESYEYPRKYEFGCTYAFCRAKAHVCVRLPVISATDVHFLSTTAKDRSKEVPAAKPGVKQKEPFEVLKQYIVNSLAGKGRSIPAGNKVFQACLGKDMSDLLIRLGFAYERGAAADGSDGSWVPPQPAPHEKRQLKFDKARRVLEDANQELFLHMAKSSSTIFPPPPSKRDLEHILGCLNYDTITPARRLNFSNMDHLYHYRVLGALPDFSDNLIDWCYSKQSFQDMSRRPLYFKSLKTIAESRQSEHLSVKAMTLASRGEVTQDELDSACRTIGIEPVHAHLLNDQMLVSAYKGRYPDSGTFQKEEMRKALQLLGNYRGSSVLLDLAQDNIDTLEQALAWLGVERNTDHEFVWSVKVGKDTADPSTKDKNTKAVEIIQRETDSTILASRLRGDDASVNPNWIWQQMSLEEARQILNLPDQPPGTHIRELASGLYGSFTDTHKEPSARQLEIAKALERVNQEINDDILTSIVQQIRSTATQVTVTIPMEDPRGLKNIGNTCYLNSLLQLLNTIKPIRDFVNLVREDEAARQRDEGDDVMMEGIAAKHNTDQASKVALELGKLFQQLCVSRENYVTIENSLAEACLELADQVAEDSEKEKKRRSTLGSLNRPSFSSPVLGAEQKISGPIMDDVVMEPDGMAEDTSEKPTGDSLITTDVLAQDPPDRSTSDDQGNGLADNGEIKQLTFDGKPASTEQDWNAEALAFANGPDAPSEDQFTEKKRKRSGHYHEDSFNLAEPTRIAKIEKWAQQQDMREVLANAYYQIGRASKGRGIGSATINNAKVERLNMGKEKVHKIDETGRHTIIENTDFTSLYVTPNSNLKDTHSLIEHGYGFDQVTDNVYHYRTFSMPLILQLEITTPPTGVAEPLQAVEPVIFMDRYVDEGEETLRARRMYRENLSKLEKLYKRQETLNHSGADMTGRELVMTASDYLEDLSTGLEDSEIVGLLTSSASSLRAVDGQLEHELSMLTDLVTNLEPEQKDLFSERNEHAYGLHAVCLHHGQSNRSGHYSIYIYDNERSTWFYYNDENVSRVTDTSTIFNPTLRTDARPALLVYVRADQHQELIQTVNRNPAPEPLQQEAPPPYEDAMSRPSSWQEEQLQMIDRLRGLHQPHELEGIDPSTLDLIPQPLRRDSAAGFADDHDYHGGSIDHVFYEQSDLDQIKEFSQSQDADDLMTFSPPSSRRGSWDQGDDAKFLTGESPTKGHQD